MLPPSTPAKKIATALFVILLLVVVALTFLTPVFSVNYGLVYGGF
jgi:hypothetical protein